MGVCIYLEISKSVTCEEWQEVYRETLQLVKAFPLAEQHEVPVRGIPTTCLVPTEEHEETYGWNHEKVRAGWLADGDYESLRTAEAYSLNRDLVTKDGYEADAPDAIYSMVPDFFEEYDWNDDRFNHKYSLWGAKTQGEPYHMYLLSIACLIESRLDGKAYVHGDITKGQCERAVSMANEYLDRRIDTPDQCDMERLFSRIDGLPLTEFEKLKLFANLYLGRQGAAFGLYVRNHFSEEALNKYWAERFGRYQVSMLGFDKALKTYLLWGFDLEGLCSFVCFTDDDGTTHYAEFVKRIMEAELHHHDKDCTDVLEIDPDEEQPYGVETLFAQIFLAGARNKKINRYIPIDEIRATLSRALGNFCPVEELIDECLQMENVQDHAHANNEATDEILDEEAELDKPFLLTRAVESYKNLYEEMRDEYDIYIADMLPYFETGDSIRPQLLEVVCKSLAFYQNALSEDRYSELMTEAPIERCHYLVQQNRHLLLRDKEWEKIFDDILNCPESFGRYYPMVRVTADTNGLRCIVRALVVNDALYSYVLRLVDAARDASCEE